MERTNLSKVVGASLLGLSIAILPANMPAHAQDSTGNNGGSTTTTTTGTAPATTTNDRADNHNGYWGLLGLLGLFGLIGRGNKGRTVAYRDPEEVGTRTGL